MRYVGADCKLDARWLELCSHLPRSPTATSLCRSSAPFLSSHHHHQLPFGFEPRKSSATNGCDDQASAGDTAIETKFPKSGSASPNVLPALRRLLLKPIAGPDWIQSAALVHGSHTKHSSFAKRGDPADSPPMLKPEPLSTAPKIKQEFISNSERNGNDVRDGLKTTSGFRCAPEVRESRPPRKRRSAEVCAFVNSGDSVSGCDAGKPAANTGSKDEYPVQNGIPSEPEVERCSSDCPPDITVDGSPNLAMIQRNEGIIADRRADDCFTHAPRKRFRYDFLRYVDDSDIAKSQVAAAATRVDAGLTGNGHDVINLTTSTRVSSDCARTRDVAVQCVLNSVDDDVDEDRECSEFRNPRRPIRQRLPPTCGCTSSTDDLASFCWYCGIVFDDDVLHAIHMGCHSVADKFVCNVCGLACGDRYGFNSHLVRGHVQTTTVPEQPAPGPVLPLQLPSTARLVPQTASLPASSKSTTSADSHRWTAYERC